MTKSEALEAVTVLMNAINALPDDVEVNGYDRMTPPNVYIHINKPLEGATAIFDHQFTNWHSEKAEIIPHAYAWWCVMEDNYGIC